MVARINDETFTQTLLTPRPELTDSDDVLLALETARALETQGEIREAARWLRRAADEAEQQGDDERVLTLARAAADLTNTLASGPAPAAEAPTIPPPPAYPPTTPPPDSFEATIPPPASPATTTSFEGAIPPPNSLPATTSLEATIPQTTALPTTTSSASAPSTSTDGPVVERSLRIGAIRVAIADGSIKGVKSFYVERLETGQPPPSGTIEAMLVFTGEIDGSAEAETKLAAGNAIAP